MMDLCLWHLRAVGIRPQARISLPCPHILYPAVWLRHASFWSYSPGGASDGINWYDGRV